MSPFSTNLNSITSKARKSTQKARKNRKIKKGPFEKIAFEEFERGSNEVEQMNSNDRNDICLKKEEDGFIPLASECTARVQDVKLL